MTDRDKPESTLHQVTAWICSLCLDGAGGECHTPGCVFFIHDAPAPADRGQTLRKLLRGVGSIDGELVPDGILVARGRGETLDDALGDALLSLGIDDPDDDRMTWSENESSGAMEIVLAYTRSS